MRAGATLGPYEIVAPLGAGGMGEVYRARDHRLNREVAIKVLPTAVAGDSVRLRRFETEARAAGQLNHPNILAVYDFGVCEGAPYLVTELLEGETLRARLTPCAEGNVALPPRKAIEIAQQVARGLAAAHARSIVHRDLKPENIFLTRDGQAKLLDFGLAKVTEAVSDEAETIAASQVTSAGQVLGTAGYMSPEQVRGAITDGRTDLFALGAILYEMLAGRRAFRRDTAAETMTAVLKEEPPAITPATGTLDAALQRVVDHCLEKDPAARFQSARDLEFALAALAGGSSTRTATLAAVPARGRRRALFSAAGILGLAMAAALGFYFGHDTAPQTHWHFTAVTSYAGVQAEPALSPDGRSLAFTSNQDGHFNIYVARIGGASPVELTHGSHLKDHPSWSPDGNTIAYARLGDGGDDDVWEVPALGGTPRRVVPHAFDPSFTRSGDLVYGHDGAVWEASAGGEDPHQIAVVPPGATEDLYPRLSPDGRLVAFDAAISGGPSGDLAVADVATGKIRLLTTSGLAVSPAWAPDSRSIYFSYNKGGALNLWEIGVDGSGLQQITSGEGDDTDLDVSADGKHIVYGTAHTEIALAALNLITPENQQTLHVLNIDPARWLFAPEFSPNGKRLVFHTSLKGVLSETIGLANADGSDAVTLVEDGRNNIFPEWSADGQSILFEAKGARRLAVRLVPVSGGSPRTITSVHEDAFSAPGRDGRFFVRNGNVVEAVDARTGQTTVMGRFPGSVPQWSLDQRQAVYVNSTGVWLTSFHGPPRRIFAGGNVEAAATPAGIYILQINPDLSTVLWKMGWDGAGQTQVSTRIPALWFVYARDTWVENQFTVSPDGKQVVFQVEPNLSENIGLLTRSSATNRQ